MQYLEEFLTAEDGHEIPIRFWRPNGVKNILVIAHGMAEHSERYEPLAEYLGSHQIAVIALNHRGHGMDCPEDDLGYFADYHGWEKVVNDLHTTIEYVKKEIPETPMCLLGHSMGSFIVQSYLQHHQQALTDVILTGTARVDMLKLYPSLILLSFIKFYKGKKATSKLVDFLSFGHFNRRFKPNRTPSDWLSRDDEQVDAYEADPFCGFSCRLLMWQDLLNGMLSINPRHWPNDVGIHLLSGAKDPMSSEGKDITKLSESLIMRKKSVKTCKLYSGARHEIINETNAHEVWDDIRDIIQTGTLETKG